MKKITLLLLSGIFALGVNDIFAVKPQEEDPLSEQPIEIKKYIISFIVGEKDFITAANNAEGFSRVNSEYRPLVIEALKNRFKKPEEAQAELFELIEERPKKLNAFALMILLKAGAKLDAQDQYGDTVLIRAIDQGITGIAKIFIEKIAKMAEKDAILNMQNNNGITALITAAIDGNTEIVKMLIKKGANLNTQDGQGRTALMYAVADGNTEIVKMLIKKGAILTMQSKSGNTALSLAKESKCTEITTMLEEAIKEQNQNKN